MYGIKKVTYRVIRGMKNNDLSWRAQTSDEVDILLQLKVDFDEVFRCIVSFRTVPFGALLVAKFS